MGSSSVTSSSSSTVDRFWVYDFGMQWVTILSFTGTVASDPSSYKTTNHVFCFPTSLSSFYFHPKMASVASKFTNNLTIGVAGEKKKEARNGGGCCSSMGLKPDSERKIKQRRGDVKIMIFKLIAKSVKDFAIGVVAGRQKKAAGNGGGSGGCVSSTTTVIPLETVGGLKPDFRYEIKKTQPLRGEIEINICEMIAGSIFQVPESGGGKKVDGGAWAGIVPMGLESRNDR
ncbi:hypothetical protein L6452_37721 [Arctium lappa]|uniref:Uncharacterized protein n=1 Tax=Arctium lappa TaxID=4217 RepID=A0ACB8Y3V3_ARCLA|nr:hypothetical protein L6452_37721 [Arctium lappa]